MNRKINVLIVDNQRRSRQSLRALIATWPSISAIREAANGVEALSMVGDFQPDLVLIDGRMAAVVGLDIVQRIKECWPEIGVVVLSMYSDLEPGAIASGADAFVTKADPPEVLLRILEAVAECQEQQGKAAGRSNGDVF